MARGVLIEKASGRERRDSGDVYTGTRCENVAFEKAPKMTGCRSTCCDWPSRGWVGRTGCKYQLFRTARRCNSNNRGQGRALQYVVCYSD